MILPYLYVTVFKHCLQLTSRSCWIRARETWVPHTVSILPTYTDWQLKTSPSLFRSMYTTTTYSDRLYSVDQILQHEFFFILAVSEILLFYIFVLFSASFIISTHWWKWKIATVSSSLFVSINELVWYGISNFFGSIIIGLSGRATFKLCPNALT